MFATDISLLLFYSRYYVTTVFFFSVKSRDASRRGDQATAESAGQSAKQLSIVSIVVGLVFTGVTTGIVVWRIVALDVEDSSSTIRYYG